MNDKTQIITLLRNEFGLWEELLTGLNEEQCTAPYLPSDLSIKDVLAHLMAWQQRSIARLEAALLNRDPEFPGWPVELDPESDDVDELNAWIHGLYHEQSWPEVHRNWRAGFLRFLDLGEAIPEPDLLGVGRYTWLDEYPLSIILLASHEHHEEHLEELRVWLRQNGNM